MFVFPWYSIVVLSYNQPFTDAFPRADIHELISMDLLHQIIKGGFKDHLVTWVGEYLEITHGKAKADTILDDIDRRYISTSAPTFMTINLIHHSLFLCSISIAPSFLGIRRFYEGRNFKQWTGDDLKALMKVFPSKCYYTPKILNLQQVYVNAIEGYIPSDMVQAIVAYLDFCFIVQRAELTESNLNVSDAYC